ncbi:MAG TPA: hypothetical protein VJT33_07015 [bacterium]|nr:hypothetical protein [bacterium]
MLEYVAYTAPLAIFWLALGVTNYICIAIGSWIRRRFALVPGTPEERALSVAHGAIFVLTGLILGFSFSYAAARYDARRALVVEEANAIGTTYLRASNLPGAAADQFRAILRDYAMARLAVYLNLQDPRTSQTMERRSTAVQDHLWSILVSAERSDTRNVPFGLLTQALNHMIDVHAEQSAALKTHLPSAMLALVLVVSIVATMLVGVHFERLRGVQTFLGLVVALLLATVVTGIVDLDRPQLGLVRVNLSPLQAQLDDMR